MCQQLGGEIVSSDSVQVYRGLHIGANKVLHGVLLKGLEMALVLSFNTAICLRELLW